VNILNDDDLVYVIGHRNSDTDTIATALGYAWIMATRDGLNCSAARAGEINPQTAFALKHFGLEPPELLTDAWMRVGQLAQRIGPLSPRQTLLDAGRAGAGWAASCRARGGPGHPGR
jgi:manganese-dependent inorganic pyrophosphatase